MAGRLAGLVAGLLVAMNGTLIVFERYVMAETLLTFLLAAAALALVRRRASAHPGGSMLLGGLLLALASLSRAAAQLLRAHRAAGGAALAPSGQACRSPFSGDAGRVPGAGGALDAADLAPGRQPRRVGAGRGAVLARLPRSSELDQSRDRSAVGRRGPDADPGPAGRLQPRLRGRATKRHRGAASAAVRLQRGRSRRDLARRRDRAVRTPAGALSSRRRSGCSPSCWSVPSRPSAARASPAG